MNERTYTVEIGVGDIVAEKMSLECAMILTKALFETYYEEDCLNISIRQHINKICGGGFADPSMVKN